MDARVTEALRHWPEGALRFGSMSNTPSVDAVVMKGKDKNGHWWRPGGEMDAPTFLQAIELVVREGMITPLQAIEAVAAGMKATGRP